MEQLESGNAVLQTIHASEGGRALKLLQQRQKRQKELENAKNSIENETNKHKLFNIDSKYKGSTTEALEEAFKKETVGLISAQEFREKRKRLNELIEETERKKTEQVIGKRACKSRVRTQVLSFVDEDNDEENDEDNDADDKNFVVRRFCVPQSADSSTDTAGPSTLADSEEGDGTVDGAAAVKRSDSLLSRKLRKDPSVNTDFLHDRDREAERAAERERLIREYKDKEECAKAEVLEVTYSYWDGSGHRRVIRISKGTTVGDFLKECQKNLEKEFVELRGLTADQLMYIKEDIVLPHGVTFYELIKNKAKGKSGPLFHFDVHDDVRMFNDARIEKDESHAGKIVDRNWYERNRHIFPASRWELYDPARTFEKYTIHGHKDFSTEITNSQGAS